MRYILDFIKKSFFLKLFIFNKKFKLDKLRGLKSINFQKFIDYDYENHDSMLYNVKLIENISGSKPFINKIIFKSIIKKKKYILVFLQTTIYSDKKIENFFFNLIYIMKIVPKLSFENKRLYFIKKLYFKKNFLLIKLINSYYLFADSSKMLEYIYYHKKFSDLSIILYFSNDNTQLYSKSFFNFFKAFFKHEKT